MSAAMSSSWRVCGASVRGAAHKRTGAPNQDAVLCRMGDLRQPTLASVSDGHGAAAHFRSQTGAALAVQAAADVLQANFDDADGAELARATLLRWRSDVRAHLSANPLTGGERKLASAPSLSPYGATLIAGAVSEGVLALMQIGDGDLLLGYSDGRMNRPWPEGPALGGEVTFSLCQDDALIWFQSAVFWRAEDASWPNFIFMATDGVSKSFQDDHAFRAEIARLRAFAASDWETFNNQAPDWLSDVSSRGSGDDATMCIAVRVAP